MVGAHAVGVVSNIWPMLVRFHPQFALAIASGAKVRPNVRILSVQFPGDSSVGNVLPASFSSPITAYSVFAGCAETIDPTNQFGGNPIKYLNDAAMAQVTGVTFTLMARTKGDDYTPIPDETPLQLVPQLLSAAAGIWYLDEPADNVKATFTLAASPNQSMPFTCWLGLVFLVLSNDAASYLCKSAPEALAELARRGALCCPPAGVAA